ncbi:MAG: DUF192 domain-containing protein [Gammaproteobacteria bacterium]
MAASACPMELPRVDANVKEAQLELEVAATPEARNCGLSRRTSLSENHGMLFVVPDPIILDFWMRDTHLPLSIAFVNDGGRILSIQAMQPMQTRQHYRSPEPVPYAIEVNRGWFAEHGIGVGDIITLQLPRTLIAR